MKVWILHLFSYFLVILSFLSEEWMWSSKVFFYIPQFLYLLVLFTVIFLSSRKTFLKMDKISLLFPLFILLGERQFLPIYVFFYTILFYFHFILLQRSSGFQHFFIGFLGYLFANYGFYISGHDCTFGSLHSRIAFLGNEEWSPILGSAQVVFNTLGIPLLFTFILLSMNSNNRKQYSFHYIYLGCFAFDAIGSMISIFILRNHLMVWRVFAPKLLFEIIFFLYHYCFYLGLDLIRYFLKY